MINFFYIEYALTYIHCSSNFILKGTRSIFNLCVDKILLILIRPTFSGPSVGHAFTICQHQYSVKFDFSLSIKTLNRNIFITYRKYSTYRTPYIRHMTCLHCLLRVIFITGLLEILCWNFFITQLGYTVLC